MYPILNVGDRVTLNHSHGPLRTGTVVEITERNVRNHYDAVVVFWDQLHRTHPERSKDLRRWEVTVPVKQWTRMAEIEAMATNYGITVQDAIHKLVNAGLSHEQTDWLRLSRQYAYAQQCIARSS